ncbi:MAG: hypothetical protein ACM3KR_11370 [Deltaproteobacteria bacterium]
MNLNWDALGIFIAVIGFVLANTGFYYASKRLNESFKVSGNTQKAFRFGSAALLTLSVSNIIFILST